MSGSLTLRDGSVGIAVPATGCAPTNLQRNRQRFTCRSASYLRAPTFPTHNRKSLTLGPKQFRPTEISPRGLRPSFSAHVRSREHGAPVRFSPGFATNHPLWIHREPL